MIVERSSSPQSVSSLPLGQSWIASHKCSLWTHVLRTSPHWNSQTETYGTYNTWCLSYLCIILHCWVARIQIYYADLLHECTVFNKLHMLVEKSSSPQSCSSRQLGQWWNPSHTCSLRITSIFTLKLTSLNMWNV